MRQQIATSYFSISFRIPKLEIREKLFRRVVKREFSFIDTHERQHGSECFGGGTNWEERVRSDWDLAFEVLNTETFDIDDALVLNHNQGSPRDSQLLPFIVYVFIDCCQLSRIIRGCRCYRLGLGRLLSHDRAADWCESNGKQQEED